MARKNEAEALLRSGHYPSEIARHMRISVNSVIQYLCLRVGEGALHVSDIYFSWPKLKREILQKSCQERYPNDRLLSSNDLCREEFLLFRLLHNSPIFHGDIYDYVALAEVKIHKMVQSVLERKFGPGESGWWREGITEDIRAKCAELREKDDEPCQRDEPCHEKYAYTTLINISKIISKNWALFQGELPEEYRTSRKKLDSDLNRLNRIRNSVMHPVKDRQWSEDDFEFVRCMSGLFRARDTS